MVCISSRRFRTSCRSKSWMCSNWVARGAAAEHIHLHFDTDERLDGRIVQFAGYPCLFHGPSPRTKPPENINRIECGGDLPHDVLRKTKLAFEATAGVAVYHHKPAAPVISHLVANHDKRLRSRNGHLQMPKIW